MLDLLLIHAPSVYDFRGRDDVLFAYLSNSDSVHVSPIFEMPPVGILALHQHAKRCGFGAEFVNVAWHMLDDPEFDVESFFRAAPARYLGVDLHWLVHAHGALELTRLYKEIHPSAKTMAGGICSTYCHEELIAYPQIDYVIRGYDTLELMDQLLKSNDDPALLSEIPNLTWKQDGQVHANELAYLPTTYSAGVDWSEVFDDDGHKAPYNIVIPQAGCEYSCRWCGGSSYFFRKYMGLKGRKTRVQKTPEVLRQELQSIAKSVSGAHTVTMIDFWHEYPALFDQAEDVFMDPEIDCVHFSLNRLPTIEKGRRMSVAARAVIELSPDSHDIVVAKASGRGRYTMEQMEVFMDALIDDVYSFEIYFMLGLPEQDAASVQGTVDYCEHILEKYKGRRVTPFICPMLPFLDPGSELFDNAEKWGYRLFHKTLEEHRQALVSMSWKHRLNYETKGLSRDELVSVSYDAVRSLTKLKAKYGQLPAGIARGIVSLIDTTEALLDDIDGFQRMEPGPGRESRELEIRARILEYNTTQLARIRSQQRPVDLGFGDKPWYETSSAMNRIMGVAAT